MNAGKLGTLPIVLVAAVASNRVIGGDNRLLWRLSTDLKRYKALTWGKPMVMGRKTFESIGKALPGRETIVITRNPAFTAPGVLTAPTLETALEIAHERAAAMGANEIIIAGGGEIYAQAMPLASRLEITEVDLAPEGDTYFPQVDAGAWRLVQRTAHGPGGLELGPNDQAPFTFVTYERS
ncbi:MULTISPECIES: dihydrofolate reductase [unclassified Beijerinckia]|uniref:dihydrofolate reductase n=1 Tax=unclassified Beijerinckia TaxID=2638183 RepID=UPI000897496B|nr:MULTISPECIES: dihydrofolate reductase [unclassified Beijerinckia]MDH7799628.1 dihydrofolate reductase [Beijerinckia sp. GAS462]SEB48150.1 dihydrofolate reductase [Beijerinckia sp. 28-YEA-48]